MKPKITLDKVNKEIFSNIDNNHFAYMLKVPKCGFVPERNFAFLFSNLDIYSLTWEGNINFSRIRSLLNKSFLTRVANSLDSIIKSKSWIASSTVTRAIDILLFHNGQKKHLKFDLFDIEQENDCYEQLLKHHEYIAFVRQDLIINTSENRFHYALTAVNRNCTYYNDSYPEVGVMFPISHRLTSRDLRWLLNLHRYNLAFSGNIDIPGSATVISKCIDKLKGRSKKSDTTEEGQYNLIEEAVQDFNKIIL